MIYDSDQNITWLADANYAATQYEESCGAIGTKDGRMEWVKAKDWAAGLNYGGYKDWRLPNTPQHDSSCEGQNRVEYGGGSYGYGCSIGELAHLFYGDVDHGLGGKAGESITNTHNENYRLFRNIVSGIYWYINDFDPTPIISLNFHTSDGYMNFNSKSVLLQVWPVRDGDVADVRPAIDGKIKRNCKKE